MIVFCSSHDAHQPLLTTEHIVWFAPIDCSQWCGIISPVLNVITVLRLIWIVVSFKSSHQVQCRYALPCVMGNTTLNIHKSTSLYKLVCICINSSILVVNLNLMERMIAHSTGMNNKSSLCYATHFFFLLILIIIVIIIRVDCRKNWGWFPNYFKRLQFTILTY